MRGIGVPICFGTMDPIMLRSSHTRGVVEENKHTEDEEEEDEDHNIKDK